MERYKLIIIPIIIVASVQIFKFIADAILNKRINFKRLVETGGMPSSHSAGVGSIMTIMGITQGFDSPIFALSTFFGIVVMYDAAGVRRAAGKQAGILNQIIHSNQLNIDTNEKLKELLGHTPIEVFMGAIWGVLLSIILV